MAIDRDARSLSVAAEAERVALVALLGSCTPGEQPALTRAVVEAGSAAAVLDERYPQDLFTAGSAAETLLGVARERIAGWARAGICLHTLFDSTYPQRLHGIDDPPVFVFTAGEQRAGDVAVSVVGSRQVSAWGSRFAHDISGRLAQAGITTVSGLAAGADTAAHTGALAQGGRTVAVLGNGIWHHYPPSNALLQDTIADNGMLLSPYFPEFGTERWSLAARNRIMSGYSIASIIVEAAERSGTRIHALAAAAQQRPIILTREVATRTRWGAKLAASPLVQIASDPVEAFRQIETILQAAQ